MRLSAPTVLATVLGYSALLAPLACQQTPPPLTARPDMGPPPNTTPLEASVLAQMWSVDGDQIVTAEGRPVRLKGIAFGNEVWNNVPVPSSHHAAADYRRVAEMGMNSVRFYLSYRTFEDDDAPGRYKEEGWAWMDQNIEWAKAAGIRLVLNMHSPAGGYQSQGKGTGLWEDAKMQKRFIDLWRAIAERYRAEPTIVAFDILNEPVPTQSIDQWKELAERTIAQIREVDQHHMVFVERVNAVGGDWSENKDRNFFRVSDPNVVYEFHFYKPYHFTHQNASWSEFAAREGWYPEENMPEVDWFHLKTEHSAESPALPEGDTDWTMIETEPFAVTDGKVVVGKPFLVCDSAKEGTVTFDSLSLTRVLGGPTSTAEQGRSASPDDHAKREVETVFELDLDTRRGWYFWTQNGEGMARVAREGHGDNTALYITGTTGPANLGSDPLRFFPQPGSEYQLQALAKGEALPKGANCRLRLEFSSSEVKVHPRGKEYLQAELDAYLAWGKREKVPLYLGEFGTIRDSYLPGRGGLKWVADMLSLLNEDKLSFAYHTYNEMPFGLHLGGSTLPTEYNMYQPLYDLFVKELGGSGRPQPEPVQAQAPPQGNEDEEVSSGESPEGEAGITEFD